MAEETNGTVFGIDLGTTYSCIAYIDGTGNVAVATNLDGDRTTPSVVNIGEGGMVTVGQVAKDTAVIEPDRTVEFVKTLIGDTKVAKIVDGVEKSPEEISSYILRKVAEDAAATTGFPVENVVITVPAYFGNDKRQATLDAGRIAGLNVFSLVQEPVAAAVYYGCTKSTEDQTVLVYDLGGGTFDVTAVSISEGGTAIQVVCSDGNHNLGGRLWDGAIVQYLMNAFRETTDYEDDYDEFAGQIFQNAAEKAKKQLTQRPEVRVPLNIAGMPAQITLTRDEFESLTTHLLDETISLTRSCLENARSKGYSVSKILLVGGSTYMPQVEKALEASFPELPREINDPNEAVAKGAALIAKDEALRIMVDIANGTNTNYAIGDNDDNSNIGAGVEGEYSKTGQVEPEKKIRINLPGSVRTDEARPIKIRLATTKSYGIRCLVEKQPKIANLILKNQPMPDDGSPFSYSDTFYTDCDNQEDILVEVFENDKEDRIIEIEGRDPIQSATFNLDCGMPADSPIEVTFSLDSTGLLHILAVEPKSGKQFPMIIETACLSATEVEQIRSNALSMKVV
ncbi:MAG: Hsp70 family protein [Coriobacteriales bacterium]|nr:Hsp70 family protein [Coriobacteriales bacterium]